MPTDIENDARIAREKEAAEKVKPVEPPAQDSGEPQRTLDGFVSPDDFA